MEKLKNERRRGEIHNGLKRKWSIRDKNSEKRIVKMCNPARRTSGTEHGKRPCRWNASQRSTVVNAGRAREWPDSSVVDDPSNSLFPGDRSRESCGTWQLPQTMTHRKLQVRPVRGREQDIWWPSSPIRWARLYQGTQEAIGPAGTGAGTRLLVAAVNGRCRCTATQRTP